MDSLLDRRLRVPRYLQIAEGLRVQMASGALAPGDQLPSFLKLRREYGVTQSTVEKVFVLLEREGLIVREPSRGTFVAPVAAPESPTRMRNGIIGVSGSGFSIDASTTYWTQLLQGMHRAGRRAGVQILLLDHESNQGWEKADGVILCNWMTPGVWQLATAGQPRLSLMLEREGTSSIRADDAQGGRLATEHLLQLGHRRIAFMHGRMDTVHTGPHESKDFDASAEATQRLGGYDVALRAAGIVPDALWRQPILGKYTTSDDFVAQGRKTMRHWLGHGWHETGCTSILAHNDQTALGVMQALAEAGLQVPDDVSVIGFDGTDVCLRSAPPLTTVRVPLEELGARSVELMLQQIEQDVDLLVQEVMPVELRVQGTTGPAPNGGSVS